jgi:uncharacterized membrane protein YidH (DUF202 family)
VKAVAFAIGVCICAVGIVGIVAPASLVWIASHFVTSGAFLAVAVIRVVFGLILASVASESRAPKTLRVLGYFIVVLGIVTAVTGLFALAEAQSVIDWWLQQETGLVRLTSVSLVVLGGFVAFACAPARRAT